MFRTAYRQSADGQCLQLDRFEAAPPFLFHTEARKLGYGAISFRTGNI